jgi:hypothetical protein
MEARLGVQFDAFVPVAAFPVCQGAVEQQPRLLLVQPSELENARARDQRADDFEIRILGGRADQRHHAGLDVRQQRVLLGLVPAMDLVHEQDGARVVQAAAFERLGDDLAQVGFARQDGRDGDEVALGAVGDDLRQGGLAGAGRPPQDDG